MKKNFQFILFNIILIIGSSSLLISNMMMRLYPNNSYLIYIITLPIILISSFLSNPTRYSIKLILNNNLLRIILISYLLMNSFIFTLSYLKITNDFFYQLTSPLIIVIIIFLTSIFISTYGIKNIINVGFILFVLIFCISLITLLNKTKFDLNLLDFNYNFNKKYQTLGILFIYLDCAVIQIFSSASKKPKFNYLFCTCLASIISIFLLLENYFLFDSDFFINGKFPYITKYLAYTNNRYFEHFDLVYLIFITIYLLIRLSINSEIFRLTCKIKRNNYLLLIFPLFIIVANYLSKYVDININILNYLTIISTILILFFLLIHLFLTRSKTYEKRNH